MVIPRPPPTPPFGPIISRLPRSFIRRLMRRSRNQQVRVGRSAPSPPPQPPPPPPPLPFGPKLPMQDIIIRRRRRRNYRPVPMLTWYMLTLMMRQKLEILNQKRREEWVIWIKDKMVQVQRDDITISWDKLCIYRVPHYLQENDNKSYFPQIVSLGPYHHGSKHLLPMEHHKWRAVNKVMTRTRHNIEIYIDAMTELEERARACYEGSISLSSNEFTQMMVLDGCFILELFRGAYKGFSELGYGRNDPVFAMRGLMHSIQRDMVMLENQLPLFVLNRLLELQLGSHNQTGLVAQLAIRFFNPLMPTDKPSTTTNQVNTENQTGVVAHLAAWLFNPLMPIDTPPATTRQVQTKDSLKRDEFFNPIADKDKEELHCLDVFRRNLLRPSLTPEPRLSRRRWWKPRVADKRQQQLIHCVTELREAGIKFKIRKTDRFWDIRFKNGYLEIPKLLIHDGTKSLFSNLIAFEQCHIDSNNDITSYIIFMDNLIDSAEDVRYLHYCGIIEHWLGTDFEVADLFNRLCQEVAFDLQDSYLSELSHKVDRNYNRKWNAVKAILKHKYFNNPWAYFSFFAAVFLLVLTLLQSYFTVYAYFKPSS